MDAVLQWLSSLLALLPAGWIAGVGIGADGIIGRHRHGTFVHKPLTMIRFSYVINIPLH